MYFYRVMLVENRIHSRSVDVPMSAPDMATQAKCLYNCIGAVRLLDVY